MPPCHYFDSAALRRHYMPRLILCRHDIIRYWCAWYADSRRCWCYTIIWYFDYYDAYATGYDDDTTLRDVAMPCCCAGAIMPALFTLISMHAAASIVDITPYAADAAMPLYAAGLCVMLTRWCQLFSCAADMPIWLLFTLLPPWYAAADAIHLLMLCWCHAMPLIRFIAMPPFYARCLILNIFMRFRAIRLPLHDAIDTLPPRFHFRCLMFRRRFAITLTLRWWLLRRFVTLSITLLIIAAIAYRCHMAIRLLLLINAPGHVCCWSHDKDANMFERCAIVFAAMFTAHVRRARREIYVWCRLCRRATFYVVTAYIQCALLRGAHARCG